MGKEDRKQNIQCCDSGNELKKEDRKQYLKCCESGNEER